MGDVARIAQEITGSSMGTGYRHIQGMKIAYFYCNQANVILCSLAVIKMFFLKIKPHQKLPKGKKQKNL